MRVMLALGAAVGLFAGASGVGVAQPAPRTLSFGDAERLSLEQSPDLRISRKGVESAEMRVKAARALRLPRFSVEANLLLWNEEIAFDVGIPGMMLPPGVEPEPIVVRDQITSTVTATLAQPLSAQLALGKLIATEQAGLAAAEQDVAKARYEVAYRVADAYLNVLLAKAGRDVTALRIEQVSAQLDRAKKLVAGGLLEPVDTMRLEAALAAVQGENIRAKAGVELAKGALVLAMGLPANTTVTVVDDFPAEPTVPSIGLADALEAATTHRADLKGLTLRAEQAHSGAEVAKADLYPNILAVATVQHNEGQGEFSSKNAWFVGLTLNWNAWDWGNRWYTYKEARVKAAQTELGAGRFADQVRLEVGGAFLEMTSGFEALGVTRAGLRAAEEAFRIQKRKFEEGVATTTDLLDAESEVSQARLGYASARFSYFRALVALARVTGQLPSALVEKLQEGSAR